MAAPTFDSRSSDYFKTLCGPNSKFKEANSGTIELKEDDPDSVEAMLRYLYSFTYPDIQTKMNKWSDVGFHMAVFNTARKYILPELQEQAVGALMREIRNIERDCEETQDAKQVFDIIKFLSANHDQFDDSNSLVKTLKKDHLAALFKLKEFRASLESDGEADILRKLMETVQRGHRTAEKRDLMEKAFLKCVPCGIMWSSGLITKCPQCGNKDRSRQTEMHLQ